MKNRLTFYLMLAAWLGAFALSFLFDNLEIAQYAAGFILLIAVPFGLHFAVSYRQGPPNLSMVEWLMAGLVLFSAGLLFILLSLKISASFTFFEQETVYRMLPIIIIVCWLMGWMIMEVFLRSRINKSTVKNRLVGIFLLAILGMALGAMAIDFINTFGQFDEVGWRTEVTKLTDSFEEGSEEIRKQLVQDTHVYPLSTLWNSIILAIVAGWSWYFGIRQFGATSPAAKANADKIIENFGKFTLQKGRKSIPKDLIQEIRNDLNGGEFFPLKRISIAFPESWYFTTPKVVAHLQALRAELYRDWQAMNTRLQNLLPPDAHAVCTDCLRRPVAEQLHGKSIPICPNCGLSAPLRMGVRQIVAWLSKSECPPDSPSVKYVAAWQNDDVHFEKADLSDLVIHPFSAMSTDMAIAKFVHAYLEIFPQGKIRVQLATGIDLAENTRRLLAAISSQPIVNTSISPENE